jgi:hypothetical protein
MPDYRKIPEWSQSAQRNSTIVDPVAVVRQVTRFDHYTRRPTTNADRALVFTTGSGVVDAFLPPLRPSRTELATRNYRAVYEIDMGIHHLTMAEQLPSHGDAFSFRAEVDITWQVIDPAQVVRSGLRDVPALISPRIQSLMRSASRKFPVEQSAEAEAAVQDRLLGATVAEDVGLRVHCTARLDLDEAARAQQTRLRTIDYDKEAAVPQFEYDLLISRQEQQLLAQKAEFYRYYLERGGIQQWAIQVAGHPEDVRHALESLREDERRTVGQQLHLIDKLLDNGEAESFQLEEAGREVLRQMKAILAGPGTTAEPSAPAEQPPLPPPSDRPAP